MTDYDETCFYIFSDEILIKNTFRERAKPKFLYVDRTLHNI